MKYIYKISFPLHTTKVYIGQTCNPRIRWKKHKWATSTNSKCHIHRAMHLYGIENTKFEVIAACLEDTKECADFNEILLIKQYNSFHNGYNRTLGGKGPAFGANHYNWGKTWKLTKEQNEQKSIRQLGKGNPFYGKTHKPKTLEKMKLSHSDLWKIYHENGKTEIIQNMKQWAQKNKYNQGNVWSVFKGNRKRHKDIVKVEKYGE